MSACEIAVVLTHSGAGMLSACGSSLILSSLFVQSRRNQKRLRPFQRLLLGLSVYDLMHSVAVSFTTLPVRADADVWGAHGTVATCTAQGFFQQQAQGGFWYNTASKLTRKLCVASRFCLFELSHLFLSLTFQWPFTF
jgi:hypothetical protein